ncbi:hypothetical protein JCM8547_008566 [Rhodosporidiobolus lusitaniae]
MVVLSTACDVIVMIEGHEGESFPLPLFTEQGEKKPFKVVQHEIERDILCDGSRAKLFLDGPHGGLMESTWPRVQPDSVLWVRREFQLTSPALSRSPSFAQLRGKGVMAAMSSVEESGGHLEASAESSRAHARLAATDFSSAVPAFLSSSFHRPQPPASSYYASPPSTTDNSPASSRRPSIDDSSAALSSATPSQPRSLNSFFSCRSSESRSRSSSRTRSHGRAPLDAFMDGITAVSPGPSRPSPSAFSSLEAGFRDCEGEHVSRGRSAYPHDQYDSRTASQDSLPTPLEGEPVGFYRSRPDLEEAGRRLRSVAVEGKNRKVKTDADLRHIFTRTSPSASRAPSPARVALPSIPSNPNLSRILTVNNRPSSPHPFTSRPLPPPASTSAPTLHSRRTHAGPLTQPQVVPQRRPSQTPLSPPPTPR